VAHHHMASVCSLYSYRVTTTSAALIRSSVNHLKRAVRRATGEGKQATAKKASSRTAHPTRRRCYNPLMSKTRDADVNEVAARVVAHTANAAIRFRRRWKRLGNGGRLAWARWMLGRWRCLGIGKGDIQNIEHVLDVTFPFPPQGVG